MTACIPLPVAVIVDSRDLRRASLASLLTAWAKLHSLELVAVSPEHVIADLSSKPECRMLVLSLGNECRAVLNDSPWLHAVRNLAPSASLVIVSDSEQPEEVALALGAGADGFIPTDIDPHLVLRAFSFVLEGGTFYPLSSIRLLSRFPAGGCSELTGAAEDETRNKTLDLDDARELFSPYSSDLTTREGEVLELLRLGKPNKLIARQLGMTEATAKVHVRHILRKLGATNRTQAALCTKSSPTPPHEHAAAAVSPGAHQ